MRLSISKFYNQITIIYPVIDFFLKPQKKVLTHIVNQLPNGKMLEIGVGDGSHLLLYQKHDIIGIDLSTAMLKVAEKRKPANVQLLKMDGQQMDFENSSFDYLIISHVIAVTENPEKLLEEAFRVLKPKGKLMILNHFTPNNWLKYIDHSFHYIGRIFHLKSKFHMEDIQAIKKFTPVDELCFGKLAYFKLLTYTKD
jgi:phosphatidylethanolamine/phosphatidyl-N-methylethanolamine N-methyltransferase